MIRKHELPSSRGFNHYHQKTQDKHFRMRAAAAQAGSRGASAFAFMDSFALRIVYLYKETASRTWRKTRRQKLLRFYNHNFVMKGLTPADLVNNVQIGEQCR